MRRLEIHDLAVRKHAPHLLGEVVPLVGTVKIVEGERAAAQQELAQDPHLVVAQPHVAGLDDVDPGVVPELRIVERQDDRVVHFDRGGGPQPAREVLFGGGRVDRPRLAPVVEAVAVVDGEGAVADADERPLQSREPFVLQRGTCAMAWERRAGSMSSRPAIMPATTSAAGRITGRLRPPRGCAEMILSSRSCARSNDGAISSAASVSRFASPS